MALFLNVRVIRSLKNSWQKKKTYTYSSYHLLSTYYLQDPCKVYALQAYPLNFHNNSVK